LRDWDSITRPEGRDPALFTPPKSGGPGDCDEAIHPGDGQDTHEEALLPKAEQEPGFRVSALYDKLYRADLLSHAYALVRSNQGAPGIDGQTFEAIEAEQGKERFLQCLREQLESKMYRADAVRRVWIPKPDGAKRPLGIPTLRDRVVQMAAKLVMEPIFEADFCEHSYGFRPKRSAH
jgi:RNA-directed DNA polymerase